MKREDAPGNASAKHPHGSRFTFHATPILNFLVVGAADWHTTAWLDGQALGDHRGGYTLFEFELTGHAQPGTAHRLVLRVDDTAHPFKLEGKQGYGPARGIWQTPYLEARGETPLEALHFASDIDAETVTAYLLEPAPDDLTLRLAFKTGNVPEVSHAVTRGAERVTLDVPMPDPHLWSLDDPFLYQVEALLGRYPVDPTLVFVVQGE